MHIKYLTWSQQQYMFAFSFLFVFLFQQSVGDSIAPHRQSVLFMKEKTIPTPIKPIVAHHSSSNARLFLQLRRSNSTQKSAY
jgi:hypothetical protein